MQQDDQSRKDAESSASPVDAPQPKLQPGVSPSPSGPEYVNEAAGRGVGGADSGTRGGPPGGHYENADHAYGDGIHAGRDAGSPEDPKYGGRYGELDAGQRRGDTGSAVPTETPQDRSFANSQERQGAQQASPTSPVGEAGTPVGGEGMFGTNAPFGGGPQPASDKEDKAGLSK